MEALPYYKWLWQDWRANRRVQRMPWQAKGLYRELLDELWVEGSLPTDMESLADIVGCTTEELTELWVHIGPCFQERDGRLFNEKMDKQRTTSDSIRVANANAGRAGGIAKLANASERLADDKQEPSARHIEEKRRLEKTREEKSTLAQTSQSESAPDRTPIGTIPCNGPKKAWPFFAEDIHEWQESFPGIDVMQQLRQCRQWNIDNPKRRKTHQGMRRSVNAWLSKAQDKAGTGVGYGADQQRTKQQRIDERSNDAIRKTAIDLWGDRDDFAHGNLDACDLPVRGGDGGNIKTLEGRLDGNDPAARSGHVGGGAAQAPQVQQLPTLAARPRDSN